MRVALIKTRFHFLTQGFKNLQAKLACHSVSSKMYRARECHGSYVTEQEQDEPW
jgi:hypothetical protein